MNSHLRQKIVNKLTNLYECESTYSLVPSQTMALVDSHDAKTVLEVIHSRVTSLSSLWEDVKRGMAKARAASRKDKNVAEVAFLEAKFQFEQLADCSGENAKAKDMKEILNLTDQAIANCPLDNSADLAKMFHFRGTVLGECGQNEKAIINDDLAIQLASDVMLYYVHRVKHLIAANRLQEAAQYIEQLLVQMDTDLLAESTRSWWQLLLDTIKTRLEGDSNLAKVPGKTVPESAEPNFELDYRCRLESSADKGRRMVASDEIQSGTLIMKERAFALVLVADRLLAKCAFCLRPVERIFWPCDSCTSAVYCNKHCAAVHWSLGHRVECGLTEWWLQQNERMLLVFRQLAYVGIEGVLELGQRCDLPPFDLLAYMHDAQQKTVAQADQDQEARLKAYKAMLSLQHHADKLEQSLGPAQMVAAIECALVALISHGYDFEKVPHEHIVDLVSQVFYNFRRVSLNSFAWHEVDALGKRVQSATAINLLASMFNHSCNPNTEWTFSEGVFHLSAVRTIRANEEICISYGPHKSMPFESRQKQNAEYYFQCNCEFCLEDAQSVFALQCPRCPGPVLCNGAIFGGDKGDEAICLLCGELLTDAMDKLKRLKRAREELHLIAPLLSGLETADKQRIYFEKLTERLALVRSLVYEKSYLLLEDIFAVCQAFHRADQLEQCLPYGELVDRLLPLEGAQLMALTSKLPPREHTSTPDLDASFDLNIDHLLFWASTVYRRWIEQTASKDGPLWETMLRFYERAGKVIATVVAMKKQRLAKLHVKKNFETVGLKEEIALLGMLQKSKADECDRLKLQMAALMSSAGRMQ